MSITRAAAAAYPATALLILLAGCNGSQTTTTPANSNRAPSTGTAQSTSANAVREAERQYVVGPQTAREFGYRVAWQYPDAGRDMKLLEVNGDSVFALDRRNFLTRIDRESGRRVWRVPVAEPVQEIIAITYSIDDERVYLTAGGRLIELDATTGSQVGTQRLEKIANTPPIHWGQFLVYGSRNGQLIWHSYPVEFQWRAYQISPSINLKPVQYDQFVVTVGNDGRIAVHDLSSATMVWDKKLLASVVAPPAVGDGTVFVAGLDQHIWAYDLYSGRSIWRHLAQDPLRDGPVLAGDRLYLQIPAEGLVCFEAIPVDAPGGNIIWEAPRIGGNVIAVRNNRVLVWSKDNQYLTVADASRGGIVEQLHLQQATRLVSTNIDGDELYAISNDGRIVRLLPRN